MPRQNTHIRRCFQLTSVNLIEQAKIYREEKFGRDRVFCGITIGKLNCEIYIYIYIYAEPRLSVKGIAFHEL